MSTPMNQMPANPWGASPRIGSGSGGMGSARAALLAKLMQRLGLSGGQPQQQPGAPATPYVPGAPYTGDPNDKRAMALWARQHPGTGGPQRPGFNPHMGLHGQNMGGMIGPNTPFGHLQQSLGEVVGSF